MSDHKRKSASAMHRIIGCPGMLQFVERLEANGTIKKNRPSSKAALTGTAAHALGERMLRGKTGTPYETFLGPMKFKDGRVTRAHVVDKKMLDNVSFYAEHIRERCREDPRSVLMLELKVSLAHIDDDIGGTLDAAVNKLTRRVLTVADYKNGYLAVDIGTDQDPNPQVMTYAEGILEDLRQRGRNGTETLELEIIQPNCPQVETVQLIEMSVKRHGEWINDVLRPAARAADEPGAPLIVGDHCSFCPAQAACPEFYRHAQETCGEDFAELAVQVKADPRQSTRKDLRVPEDVNRLADVLRAIPALEAWFKVCEARAQELLECGIEVPGHKLVQKRSNRTWPDMTPASLLKALGRAGASVRGVTVDSLYGDPEILSPAQMEKVFGRDAVCAVAIKPDAGYTVAVESDRREAIVLKPGADFEDLAS